MIPKAFIFDVFGTCVDWRSSVARDVARMMPNIDPFAFADAWRAEYEPAMARIRQGDRGYVPLDVLHLENLRRVCDQRAISCPDPKGLTRAWERLDPWADVVPGLHKLKTMAIVAPCSNGSIALMTRLARYGGLAWDCILGADIAQDYKPSAAVYQAACTALALPPDQVMMVAAHNSDLVAARRAGLRTGFVPRPTEHGPSQTIDLTAQSDWDIIATDFDDLAKKVAK